MCSPYHIIKSSITRIGACFVSTWRRVSGHCPRHPRTRPGPPGMAKYVGGTKGWISIWVTKGWISRVRGMSGVYGYWEYRNTYTTTVQSLHSTRLFITNYVFSHLGLSYAAALVRRWGWRAAGDDGCRGDRIGCCPRYHRRAPGRMSCQVSQGEQDFIKGFFSLYEILLWNSSMMSLNNTYDGTK